MNEEKTLYLTFDNGWENGLTPSYLDTLKEKNVKAIFFLTGDYAKKEDKLVKRLNKNEITKKDEDKYTITEKEVAVRKIWNVSNTAGAFKSFTSKDDALKSSKLKLSTNKLDINKYLYD